MRTITPIKNWIYESEDKNIILCNQYYSKNQEYIKNNYN